MKNNLAVKVQRIRQHCGWKLHNNVDLIRNQLFPLNGFITIA